MTARPASPTAPELDEPFGFATAQVHAGADADSGFGARVAPIYLSAGFVFDDFDQARERFAGDDDGYTYSRTGNPTTAALERRLAVLEAGLAAPDAQAIVVGSGQAALTVALLGILQAGDHIVSSSSIYEGTRGLLRENLGRLGIEVDFVPGPNGPGAAGAGTGGNNADAWRRAIRPNTKALFGEPIPNPKNDLLDIEAVAGVAREFGIPFIVDNTLATPYLLRPIEYGADIVVHSASKFLAGHGTALGGVVVDAARFDWSARPDAFPHLNSPHPALGGRSYVEAYGRSAYAAYARQVVASRFGPTLSPLNAFLLQQGLETLSLRVAQHSRNALAVAAWLQVQPEVESVDYSGLASSPHHALASKYLPEGQGSVFSFTLHGGEPAARAFYDALRLFSRMTHLGDVRSLALHPASTTHTLLSEQQRLASGIGDGLLRLSVGIEDADDLIRDLARGLEAVRALDASRSLTLAQGA
ncbi:O-acetylhomoserine aminocarboxypropyltransferase/cysteine synthase family protein [Rathayibacter sp. KR2-224]|uniref:O-acetylhomoserine aminocarboxypropyltransferase/cysteine synthase family protein n=1 Tax=Rathayibacter sp. KR2-224 TaxID=3400913 RepID=UPI003C07FFDC